jgi:hypothetical protein
MLGSYCFYILALFSVLIQKGILFIQWNSCNTFNVIKLDFWRGCDYLWGRETMKHVLFSENKETQTVKSYEHLASVIRWYIWKLILQHLIELQRLQMLHFNWKCCWLLIMGFIFFLDNILAKKNRHTATTSSILMPEAQFIVTRETWWKGPRKIWNINNRRPKIYWPRFPFLFYF